MPRRRRRSSRRALPLLALLVLAAGALWLLRDQLPHDEDPAAPPAPRPTGTLRVHYVDVGQGDAVVWELGDGSLVLFDCGDVARSADGNPLVRHLRDVLRRPAGSEIHALVASHGHRDHVGGCDEVFETYRVRHVYDAWYEGDDRPQSYRGFQDLVLAEGAQLHAPGPVAATEGERVFLRWDPLALPPGSNATAQILWPAEAQAPDWDRVAEHGLVVRLAFGDVAFCFQGDVETAQERRLAAEPVSRDLSCDAYLVGHHGSRHASDSLWLRRMAPSVAIVSFGENPYGHPTSEALCRTQQAGANVYATHALGTVTIDTDGTTLRVTPDRPETKDYCGEGVDYWG